MTQADGHKYFEHHPSSLEELRVALEKFGVDRAIMKLLPRNANDKNQIYFGASFTQLYDLFDMTLNERGMSESAKLKAKRGEFIPEAVFNDFRWIAADGSSTKAKGVRAIVYTQYPETRISGFSTEAGNIPTALTVGFTKKFPQRKRLLVLGQTPKGACIAMLCVDLSDFFLDEMHRLPNLKGSKVWKVMQITGTEIEILLNDLSRVVGQPLKGCRLDSTGATIPFSGTQVCGYTLEHALGVIPNSRKSGDINGIEIKAHTSSKVTLFTPEPDFGLYAEDFALFMTTYGYRSSKDGSFRLTGLHRANARCDKSGLTLKAREFRLDSQGGQRADWIRNYDGNPISFLYDPATPLTPKMESVDVVLVDDKDKVVAGWSLNRLLNNWSPKHSKAIYVSAEKRINDNLEEFSAGFKYLITFGPAVIICEGASAESLLTGISQGLIFLDPAPKFVPTDLSKNKRRAQWRVNQIETAVGKIYKSVTTRNLCDTPALATTRRTF